MPENEEEIDIMSINLNDEDTIDLTDEKVDNKKESTVEDAVIVDVEPEEVKPKKKTSRRKGKTKPTEEVDTTPEPEIVDVDELKQEQHDEKVVIDFMNADQSEDFIKKKTQKSELNLEIGKDEEESLFKGKSIEEVREQIRKEEEESGGTAFKPENFEEIARLIIDVIDLLMSALLRWYAKDTTDQPYSLSKSKKDKVVYSLSLVLMKHQKKWSVELMFALTIIGVYSGPVLAAQSHRKEVKAGTAETRKKGGQTKA